MNKIALLFIFTVFITACTGESAPSDKSIAQTIPAAGTGEPASIQSIGSSETKALLAEQQQIVMLDVRTPEEYAAGHLKGAKLINFYSPDFRQRVQALDPAKTYLVYCAVGGRSKEAVQTMAKLGFKQVYDATEGFSALKNAGIPTE